MTQTAYNNQLSRILHRIGAWCVIFSLTVCSLQFAAAQKNDVQNLSPAAIYTVTTLNDSGAGSFREAINQANSSAGSDEIRFDVTGTINLVTPLPAITDPVVINVQTSSNLPTPNTPTIELNGQATQNTGPSSIGLWIRAGSTVVKGFAINRFGEAGIRMDTDGVVPQNGDDNGNQIKSSYIGTNLAGSAALGNINRGILIVGTTGHLIGGGTADRNIISGNQGRGVEITAEGSAIVTGNYIGTNAAGTGDLGNTSDGVLIANSSNSTIGYYGALGTPGNVISGNNGNGVSIITDFGSTASNNHIQGNYIGTNANGNTALGNNGSGVSLQAQNNTVGGSADASLRNIISGNRVNGVSIGTTFGTNNTISGNFIGVGANGTTAIGNRDNGIQISNTAANNAIGGGTSGLPGACDGGCNVIANNGDANSFSARAGVYVDRTAGVGNYILYNSIFNNTGIGIDLGAPGNTANDANDPDIGPNNLQNFPIISSALTSGTISGSLNSTPNSTFRIDFYRNAASDGTGSEGRNHIGVTSAATDASGNATFNFNAGGTTLTAGQFVTATATSTGGGAQAIGDTSEFSGQTLVTTSVGIFTISGRITYAVPVNNPNKPVSGAIVTAVGPVTQSDDTDANGNYEINNLPPGNYVVTPSKSNDDRGAITAFDATLILRCVAAGSSCSLTANQQKAGDADNDSAITAFDATLILRYVAANGPNANTGRTGNWEFNPPQRSYTPLAASQTNQDYEAILVGDVDGDWAPPAQQTRQSAKAEVGNHLQEFAASVLRMNLLGYFSPR